MVDYIGLTNSIYTFINSHGVFLCAIIIVFCTILSYFREKKLVKFKGELDNKNLYITKKIEIYIEFFDMFSKFKSSISLILRRFYYKLPIDNEERKKFYMELLCDSIEKYNDYSMFIEKNDIFFDERMKKQLSDIRHISSQILFEYREIFIDSNENDRLELVGATREYFKKAEVFRQKTDRVKTEIRKFLKQLENT